MKTNKNNKNSKLIYENKENNIKLYVNLNDGYNYNFSVYFMNFENDFFGFQDFNKDWNFKLMSKFDHDSISNIMTNYYYDGIPENL